MFSLVLKGSDGKRDKLKYLDEGQFDKSPAKFHESVQSFGVAGQPRHCYTAHAGHMRRGHLAHAARTGHPRAHPPVLEAAAQRPRSGCGRFEKSVMGSDWRDGGDSGGGQGRGGNRREERVVHGWVRCVGSGRVRRPRVRHCPARGRVEAPVMPAAAVDFAHQPLHLLQRVAQHQDVVSRQQQSGNFGEFAHGRSVRIWHHLAQPVHGHVQIVHPFPLAAVDLEADGLEFALWQEFSVFLCRHPEGQLFVSAGEAAQAGHLRRRVALCGRHRARKAMHGLLQGGNKDVIHLWRGRSAWHTTCIRVHLLLVWMLWF